MEDKFNVSRLSKGLNNDFSPQDQPKGTYRFALNSVSETENGDQLYRSNEESNEDCGAYLPEGYIPLGKRYMSNGKTAVLSVSEDETTSEIGILYSDCRYETHVNTTELEFRISNQIDIIFRLRRGCEEVIYFTDGLNKIRNYNFTNPEDFKDEAGNWDADKFNLIKTYSRIPDFSNIEIEDGGILPPGSYNFSIQYLDQDLNPTEWITTSDTVIIYNSNIQSIPFEDIRGSTSVKTLHQDFGNTSKSIRLSFSNLDQTFPFYRVAVIESNNASGQISRVIYSNEISTEVDTFSYTGDEGFSEGTVEEIQQFREVIETAEHIHQLENRMLLGSTTGKQINWCRLQKYASKIKADLATQEVVLNNINLENNPRRGQLHNEKVGYMPGEIYSFGIVWVFSDGTLSPVYHIPGRNPSYGSQMSSDNQLENTFYTDNDSCLENESYWGVDSQGDPLKNEKIRHHRFPYRTQVDKPLVIKDNDSDSVSANYLYLDITGEISDTYSEDTIEWIVTYEIDSTQYQQTGTINVSTYNSTVGDTNILLDNSTDDITVISVQEIVDGSPVDPSTNSELIYNTRITQETTTFDDSIYTTEIFGITFSNIDLPSPDDTGGEQIIGYYIVRNDRTENNKTILDSGVITPLINSSKFTSHGHLYPKNTNLKEDIFAIIHPEHKFRGKEYTSTTRLIQQGYFEKVDDNITGSFVQDVSPGSSYDPDAHKSSESDDDGFDLNIGSRDNLVEYTEAPGIFADTNEIVDLFYLDALYNKSVTDIFDNKKEIFNISSDNKIGIVQLSRNKGSSYLTNKAAYVLMRRDLTDPYNSFRVLPYYKQHNNYARITQPTGNQFTVFGGDSYVSPMRYSSSMFYEIRLADRKEKTGFWNVVLGGLSIIGGVLLSLVPGGQAASIAMIGLGVSQIASGIKRDQIAKVYQELYEQGLDDTVYDMDTQSKFGTAGNDDEIRWFTDTATNFWFESSVNMNWRMGATAAITDFLNAPGSFNEGMKPYFLDKITSLDSERGGGRTYQGYAKAELYEINLDFLRRNKEKTYYHLGIEYDCCSKCVETFPHRIRYSEQSFQEELTDNYRIFLPNNYRDIEGETGKITNLFKIQNNLYIHTEEGLWHLPDSVQERVSDDIVSFIGTGEFFAIPPRLIVDSESGNSAGTKHKWGMIKTPYGVFFPSEHQNTIFKFNGEKLTPLNEGLFNWFKNNMEIKMDRDYYIDNHREYPYINNPSNKLGTGFISTYDSRKERVIFTKKDFYYSDNIIEGNEICNSNGSLVVFENFNQTIQNESNNGWRYIGIEDCKMKFEKISMTTKEVQKTTVIPNNTDVHVFYDTSGSFGNFEDNCLQSIDEAVDLWLADFQVRYPDWNGNLYKYLDDTERWVNYAQRISSETYPGQDLSTKDILVISFCNEASPVYHDGDLDNPLPLAVSAQYSSDYSNFISLYNQYNSFIGIHYPIVFGNGSGGCPGGADQPATRNFLLHSLASVKGITFTQQEVDNLTVNPGFTTQEWDDLKQSLTTSNPYSLLGPGLEDYGWSGKWDRAADSQGNVINAQQFSEDIEDLLQASSQTETVEVQVPYIEYKFIAGSTATPTVINNGWTLSYSLKDDSWTSFHSYMPNIYINTPDRFYSWKYGNDSIWKHNKYNNYQNFYGIRYPFIIEFVGVTEPLMTKIWDYLKLITEAKKYDSNTNEFVEQRYVTFNKGIFYNSRQCTGELNFIVKDTRENSEDYLEQQVQNLDPDSIILDRNEKDWTLNELRDYRSDYSESIFNSNKENFQDRYYIDKIVNSSSIDFNKDWTELESLRDKYLVVRLIFDNFDDVKLLLNYSIDPEKMSYR